MLSSLGWSVREVGASARRFVRLVVRDDVERLRTELGELSRRIVGLERAIDRLESGLARSGDGQATSAALGPSQERGTP